MIEIFFNLLRAGLWNTVQSKIGALSEDQWEEIYVMSSKQGVLGIVFDGINKLPKEMLPSKTFMHKWFCTLLAIERGNLKIDIYLQELIRLMKGEGLNPFLFKGQSVGQYYPTPNHRQKGDIDFVMGKDFKRCAEFLINKNFINYRSYTFVYKDEQIDLHKYAEISRNYFVNYRLHRQFDKWMKKPEKFRLGDEVIDIPPLNMYHICMILHIRRHLIEDGIGLKQVCDMVMLLNARDCDKDELKKWLVKFDLGRFARALYAFLIKDLGLDESKVPLMPDYGRNYKLLKKAILDEGYFHKWFFDKNHQYENFHSHVYGALEHRFERSLRFWSLMPWEAFWTPIYQTVRFIKLTYFSKN